MKNDEIKQIINELTEIYLRLVSIGAIKQARETKKEIKEWESILFTTDHNRK